jgi:hypothetical protein
MYVCVCASMCVDRRACFYLQHKHMIHGQPVAPVPHRTGGAPVTSTTTITWGDAFRETPLAPLFPVLPVSTLLQDGLITRMIAPSRRPRAAPASPRAMVGVRATLARKSVGTLRIGLARRRMLVVRLLLSWTAL